MRLAVMAVGLAVASASAQRPDSLAYIRDSTLIDSLARLLPVDSLRDLYRRVPGAADPVSVIRAIQCESYRLSYTFGRAADIAEERVASAEWPPNVTAAVRRALDSAAKGFLFPTRPVCGIADDAIRAPERLRFSPRAPWTPPYV